MTFVSSRYEVSGNENVDMSVSDGLKEALVENRHLQVSLLRVENKTQMG